MHMILIRHGEAEGNRKRYIGREDVPLTRTGEAQAAELPGALDSMTIDRIFCSPLSRTIATAEPLARVRGLEIEIRDELQEVDFGKLQGAMKAAHSFNLAKEHLREPMPGGESLADVSARLDPVAEAALGVMRAGGVPALVGHYWSNRVMLAKLSGAPFSAAFRQFRYKPENGSAYAIRLRDGQSTNTVESVSRLWPMP